MNKWNLIETTLIPGGTTQMSLFQNGDNYSICVDGKELMNTRMHGSEESLAHLGCRKLKSRQDGNVLVGGLGMGFTLAATLKNVGQKANVEVAELVPAVVEWNRDYLGAYADWCVRDPRVRLNINDVANVMHSNHKHYDAILLDVDNGPSGMTQEINTWLYWPDGLKLIRDSLRPGGILAVWSAYPDRAFHKRLLAMGFKVEEHRVAARASGGGGRHIIWLAE